MKSFLNIVAEDILKRYGTDLSRTVVVFPNKRASLFLNEELIRQSGKEYIWSPRYLTISELFRRQSNLIVADQVKLVCELYKVAGNDEPLDEFYSWGEMLIADFDDVDKNMGDAVKVFENTSELHEYDSVEYLTDEQRKALKDFFSNFTDNHDAKLRKRFTEFWNKLYSFYTGYRELLRSNGIAYEGMLYRDVIETCSSNMDMLDTLGADRFIFIGFNMLHKVEQQLFSLLERKSEVHYYWDFDEYYMKNQHEAGYYINEYLKHFPNDICEKSAFQNFNSDKSITYINASTEDIQARYISQWLTEDRIKAGKRTAIVLCNEGLLPTVVNCLPKEVQHVNITTGYPLNSTPSAVLIQQIFNLRLQDSEHSLHLRQVNNVLRHPYAKYISEKYEEIKDNINSAHIFFPTLSDFSTAPELVKLFEPLKGTTNSEKNIELADRLMWAFKTIAINSKAMEGASISPLMQESVFRTYTLLSRFRSLVLEDGLDVDSLTFQRLINEAIRTTSVPFHGEPIMGIQIMGVLETRNLDFDHILILSCNEGNMPKGVNDASFIPHAIRNAYGLTTVEHKVGIYAYYFHRLLQRASDIEIAYNSSTEDGQMGEKSRFMSQLLAESGLKIDLKTFNSVLKSKPAIRIPIEKNAAVMNILDNISHISPSSINTYLRCPLQFFYKVVCGIKDSNEDEDDTDLDNRVFGLIFHYAMEELYKPFCGKTLTGSIIESIQKDERKVSAAIDNGIKKELFKFKDSELETRKMPRLDGSEEIKRKVIRRLIAQQLEYDRRTAPISLDDVEKSVAHPFTFEVDGKERTILINGKIDRLDTITNKTVESGREIRQKRVVDYKTGHAAQPSLESLDDVFNPDKIEKHSDYYLQTLLYCILEDKDSDGTPISPCLIYPSHAFEGYDPTLTFGTRNSKAPILNAAEHADEFMKNLRSLLTEIFTPSVSFTPTTTTKRCEKCFYSTMCGK